MPALLALIPFKDWCYLGCVAALLIGFGAYTHHERAIGEAKIVAVDAAVTKKILAQTAAQTAELKAKATMAEQAYDKEHALIDNQSDPTPVRLCLNSHASRLSVPAPSAPDAGNGGTSTSTTPLQPLSTGDLGVAGPDIGHLLDLLARRGDTVSATLREYQSR
jgi:hypothetical protein